ncbi:cyclase family protein [Microbacterium sp. CJ77]|uniref:cyclase family protein n=1 Tax=Microbacterium sp. CJ77 TaxID=2079201 RepID=UPI000CD853CE|nr:cyclase family protein [Microbacterium sp. CJ77]
MTTLVDLTGMLRAERVEIIDLTNKLTQNTPSLKLPFPFGSPAPFELEEISAYDDRGPGWKHNNIHIGEHTGTHLDVPIHWASGRDGDDVSQVPLTRLIGPAVVLDVTAEATEDADFLVDVHHVQAWEAQHGPLPPGAWLLVRTGWSAYSQDEAKFVNRDEIGPHTPGFTAACAKWLAESPMVVGVGVETLGIDAGQADKLTPPRPMHHFLLGGDTYGITSLQNLDRIPTTGAVIIVAPLPIVGGTGSPARVLALVERDN